jgi:hypothetical protein
MVASSGKRRRPERSHSATIATTTSQNTSIGQSEGEQERLHGRGGPGSWPWRAPLVITFQVRHPILSFLLMKTDELALYGGLVCS